MRASLLALCFTVSITTAFPLRRAVPKTLEGLCLTTDATRVTADIKAACEGEELAFASSGENPFVKEVNLHEIVLGTIVEKEHKSVCDHVLELRSVKDAAAVAGLCDTDFMTELDNLWEEFVSREEDTLPSVSVFNDFRDIVNTSPNGIFVPAGVNGQKTILVELLSDKDLKQPNCGKNMDSILNNKQVRPKEWIGIEFYLNHPYVTSRLKQTAQSLDEAFLKRMQMVLNKLENLPKGKISADSLKKLKAIPTRLEEEPPFLNVVDQMQRCSSEIANSIRLHFTKDGVLNLPEDDPLEAPLSPAPKKSPSPIDTAIQNTGSKPSSPQHGTSNPPGSLNAPTSPAGPSLSTRPGSPKSPQKVGSLTPRPNSPSSQSSQGGNSPQRAASLPAAPLPNIPGTKRPPFTPAGSATGSTQGKPPVEKKKETLVQHKTYAV